MSRGKVMKNWWIPMEACKNLDPILESNPTALATSETSAPVASHTADNELILEILWANIAFAAYKKDNSSVAYFFHSYEFLVNFYRIAITMKHNTLFMKKNDFFSFACRLCTNF